MTQRVMREKELLEELEKTLEGHKKEQERAINDILRTASFETDDNSKTHLKMTQLQEAYEEAQQQRQEMKDQLEWTQALLSEQRSLRERFKPSEPRSQEPTSEQPVRLTRDLALKTTTTENIGAYQRKKSEESLSNGVTSEQNF